MRGNKRLICVYVAFVLLCAFAGAASAGTIYVPDNYTKIQWAVDNATAGDTIIVRPGTYTENIDVNESVEIRSYSQNTSDTIVEAFNSNDHIFYVTANNVTIKGFKVTGAGSSKAGICLYNSNNSRIENVDASNNWCGIHLHYSYSNTIKTNRIENNTNYGIYIKTSQSNHIYNNYFNNINNTYINGTYPNDWNVTKQAGTNIVNGNYLGGNYWAKPDSTGFSQTCTDADGCIT